VDIGNEYSATCVAATNPLSSVGVSPTPGLRIPHGHESVYHTRGRQLTRQNRREFSMTRSIGRSRTGWRIGSSLCTKSGVLSAILIAALTRSAAATDPTFLVSVSGTSGASVTASRSTTT